MDRAILHSDLNNCYASIECLRRPELRGKPMAVGGDEAARRGIVLAKNEEAKRFGIKTGEPLWQARGKCPGLVLVPPDFGLYLKFCRRVRELYYGYTNQVEPFGLDEAWLDVTGSAGLFGTGEEISNSIRERIKTEFGVTVSVGVSFNKVFAKLGSDMKKPDAVTVITRENFKEKVWPLPVESMLYVGASGSRRLRRWGVDTIGALANSDPASLEIWLGKNGLMLYSFANGLDISPVLHMGEERSVKSIGNGTTFPYDLETESEIRTMFCVLAESVAERLREGGFLACGVQIAIKDSAFNTTERQTRLICPTNLSSELIDAAAALFKSRYTWEKPVRALSLRAFELLPDTACVQTAVYRDETARARRESLERTIDGLRSRFGRRCVLRASLLANPSIGALDPKADHVIHPVGYF